MDKMSELGLGYLKFQGYKEYFEKLKQGTENVRAIAAFALGQIGDESTVEQILETLKQEDSSVVKIECIRALINIRDDKANKTLADLLKDDNASVRATAALALGTLKASEAITGLIDALHDMNTEVRVNAIDSIAEIGTSDALNPIYNALKDPEAQVRRHAAGALGVLGKKESIPYLVEKLNDADTITKMMAAWSLGEIGDEALGDLIDLLEKSKGEDRIFALEAIILMPGAKKALPIIEKLAESNEKWVQNVAKQAIAKIK